jgi:hypothetical protein
VAEESGGEDLYAGGRNRRGGWPTTHQSVREPGILFFFSFTSSIREKRLLHKAFFCKTVVGGMTIEEANWREIVVSRGRVF